MSYSPFGPARYECETLTSNGLVALAHAHALDLKLSEINEAGINPLDGFTEWTAFLDPIGETDFVPHVEQTMDTLRRATSGANCDAKFEVDDGEVRVQCRGFACKLGEISVCGVRTSSLTESLPLPANLATAESAEASQDQHLA